jgi:F0F1-type ATP synthase membrane subunit b/b'
MSINPYEIGFTILNTLILFFIMRRFFFKPIGDFMKKRTDSVQSKIQGANDNYAKAEKLGREYELKIASAETDGKKIVDEYKNKANALYQSITEDAKNEAELIRERAKIDAQREKEKATLYTRDIIIGELSTVLPQLVDIVLKTHDNMLKVVPNDYEATFEWGQYANPSFESMVETIGKAKTYGIMSVEQCIDELYGDTMSEDDKLEEVTRLKAESTQVVAEPSVGGMEV